MSKNLSKILSYISLAFMLLFIVLIILLKTLDVQINSLTGEKIGLATINKAVFESLGVNETWQNITNWLGYLAIFIIGIFAIIGIVQLIKRKSLKKVDKDIIAFGVFVIFIMILYVFFEIVAVNYRPIFLDNSLKKEPSFPSTHTFLIVTIMGMTIIEIFNKINNKNLKWLLSVVCCVIAITATIGRLISGVHWFTDILGGVILSVSLIILYLAVVLYFKEKLKNQ